jgi:predicted transcriptional regulator
MKSTQIKLTAEQDAALARLANGLGKEDIIRRAIEEYILRHDTARRLDGLQAARGIWKNRTDIPDLRTLRKSRGNQHLE